MCYSVTGEWGVSSKVDIHVMNTTNKQPEHIHKYIKVSNKYTALWKCADPYCKHFIYTAQELILLGRASICWGCSNVFPMSEESMKEDQPMCDGCRNPFTEAIPDIDAFIESHSKKSA